jgi:hypothetical protein
MRTRSLFTTALLALLVAFGAASPGCSKKSAEPASAEATDTAPHGITEGHDGGSIVWEVKPDGKVRALVKTADGKPTDKDVKGTLLWKAPSGDTKVPLTFDEKSGMLVGSGPKLEGDLTEIRYTVTAGNAWAGALHVPAGGTDELEDSAKRAAQKSIPKGKTGPNGGIVQVVGDDVVEIVADKSSGQLRVYLLDASDKPVAIGNRKVKLGLVGGSVEEITLSPGPGGLYFVGKLGTKVDPVKLTIAITSESHTEVVLCGYEPGVVVVVGSEAPTIHLLIVVNWSIAVHGPGVIVIGDDDDGWHGHGHGHWGGHGHGH